MRKLYLTLLLALLSANSLLSQNFEVDGIAYNITSAEAPYTVEVTSKSLLYSGDIVIPEEVFDGGIAYSVSSIANFAFDSCSELTSIVIPNSIWHIGKCAFSKCNSLISINVGVENAQYASADGVLYNEKKTLLILYPNGKDGDHFAIPNSVESIYDEAFSDCLSLTSIEIPASVTSIGYGAFRGCLNLTSIEIPYSVTNIDHWAFSKCASLGSLVLPNSLTDIGDGAFADCESLTSIVLPNSLTSIGNWVFESCVSLTTIEIPNSVTSIGNGAFEGCSDLESIVIPNSVTNIGNMAFAECTGLTIIEISNSVTSIGHAAFEFCVSLASIEIPVSVTNIGDMAFAYCFNLSDLVIPNSVKSIGEMAFAECISLGYIQIPNSVTNIGDKAFAYCMSLEAIDVDLENLNYSSDNGVLYDKEKTMLIQFPKRTEDDGYSIPGSVTSIGGYALYGSWNLVSIEIPRSVTNIGIYAFSRCSRLTSITCYAENPPILELNVFMNVPKDIPLYVPASSVALYQQADQWKEFNITPMVTTSRKKTTEIHSNIEIYPNPVSDLLNIDLGGFHGEVSFKIFNAAGQSILSGQFASTKTINTGSFEPGIYVIRMNGDNWVETKRFIKR